MNMIVRPAPDSPSREEAAAALALLARLAATNPAAAAELGLSGLVGLSEEGALARRFDEGFRPDEAYRASLPDLQNGPSSLIRGEATEIQHVGISNFRLPLAIRARQGAPKLLEAAVTGSVSLEAAKKGINMSRIMRSFYAEAEAPFDVDALAAVVARYKRDLGSFDARVEIRFRYPMEQASLRSGLKGWQYYDVAFETAERGGETLRALHLDYVYSSTCPCSLELSEHARISRGRIATPHSQRSVARLSLALADDRVLWIEDLVELCRAAIPTETQVMVKREDEQAFAELNGANPIFVEDAARLLAEAVGRDGRVGDFRIAASHQESLHSHDAVSVLTRGPAFASTGLEPHLFGSLIHGG